jgi:hypothetical protein
MGAARGSDPEAAAAQLRAVVQPMAAGPLTARLVRDARHFLAEENPRRRVAGRYLGEEIGDPHVESVGAGSSKDTMRPGSWLSVDYTESDR